MVAAVRLARDRRGRRRRVRGQPDARARAGDARSQRARADRGRGRVLSAGRRAGGRVAAALRAVAHGRESAGVALQSVHAVDDGQLCARPVGRRAAPCRRARRASRRAAPRARGRAPHARGERRQHDDRARRVCGRDRAHARADRADRRADPADARAGERRHERIHGRARAPGGARVARRVAARARAEDRRGRRSARDARGPLPGRARAAASVARRHRIAGAAAADGAVRARAPPPRHPAGGGGAACGEREHRRGERGAVSERHAIGVGRLRRDARERAVRPGGQGVERRRIDHRAALSWRRALVSAQGRGRRVRRIERRVSANGAERVRAGRRYVEGARSRRDGARRASARDARRLATVQYEAGTAGYLQVLLADQQYRQARLAWVQASAQRLQDTVALYAALGGGWGGARQP